MKRMMEVKPETQVIICTPHTLYSLPVFVQPLSPLLTCWMTQQYQLMDVQCTKLLTQWFGHVWLRIALYFWGNFIFYHLHPVIYTFYRYVLERLTRDKQEEMFKILRHLIRFIPKLPQQAAFALYNYIIGYVMFYVRSPHEDGQQLIGSALSLLWMVI